MSWMRNWNGTILNHTMEKRLDFELCAADRSPGNKRFHPASDQCFRYTIYSSLCFSVNQGFVCFIYSMVNWLAPSSVVAAVIDCGWFSSATWSVSIGSLHKTWFIFSCISQTEVSRTAFVSAWYAFFFFSLDNYLCSSRLLFFLW